MTSQPTEDENFGAMSKLINLMFAAVPDEYLEDDNSDAYQDFCASKTLLKPTTVID